MSHPSRTFIRAQALSLLLAFAATPFALAQTPAPEAPPAESPPAERSERIERITHEDGLSRIDELRVGGETRSIQVQPKNGAPGYEIAPVPGGTDLSDNNKGSSGKSRWRIFNF